MILKAVRGMAMGMARQMKLGPAFRCKEERMPGCPYTRNNITASAFHSRVRRLAARHMAKYRVRRKANRPVTPARPRRLESQGSGHSLRRTTEGCRSTMLHREGGPLACSPFGRMRCCTTIPASCCGVCPASYPGPGIGWKAVTKDIVPMGLVSKVESAETDN